MIAVAFDLGTAMGWAVYTRDKRIRSGVEGLAPFSAQSRHHRFVNERHLLSILSADFGPFDVVFFEDVNFPHKSHAAAYLYANYKGTLLTWCCEQTPNPIIHGLRPYQIKQVATGRGNASKDEMKDAGRAKGWRFRDDNECDALWTLYAGMAGKGKL